MAARGRWMQGAPAGAALNSGPGILKGGRVASELETLMELAQLFDSVPGIQFWIKDKEGRFISCSRSFAAHFGLSGSKDMEGRTDFDVSPHHLAEEYVADDRAVLSSGMVLMEKLELVRESDGSLCWYSTTKVPLRGAQGSVIGTAGATRKLSGVEERKSLGRDLGRAVREISTNYGKDLSIADLAALSGMSVDGFESRFLTAFRETPLKYLNRIRMRAACRLLIHSDLPLAKVALHCGFDDPDDFSKSFSIRFHIQPLAYRKKFYSRVKG